MKTYVGNKYAYCQIKEANLKTLHTVGFQPDDILERRL